MPIKAIRKLPELRYILLAGTLMSALAIPYWAASARDADGRIIVAQQNVDPKDKNKGKQPPPQKGPPPQSQPAPKGPPPQQSQPVPKGPPPQQQGQPGGPPSNRSAVPGGQPGGPGQPGQPKQFSNQPPGGGQPGAPGQPRQFGNQPPGGGQPGAPGQPKQFGNQPPGGGQPGAPAQPKQFSNQPPGGGQPGAPAQPKQFGNQPPGGGQPGAPAQPKQFSNQPPAGVQPGAPAQPKQFSNQPPGGGQPGAPAQPKQFSNQPPGGGLPGAPGQPKQPGAPGQPGVVGAPGQPGGPGQPQQKQFSAQPPASQNQQVGNIDQLRSQRQTSTDPGGRTVIQEGNRTIVQDQGRTFIRANENQRFAGGRVEQRGNETYNIVSRPGGVQIINVTDRNGQLIRRVRRGPDQREVVMIDNRRGPGFGTGLVVGAVAAGVTAAVLLNLRPPVVDIPRERYIVDLDRAPPDLLYETLEAPPLMEIERPYSLDEIRYNVELRDRMRRIDINTITFDTGSWQIAPDQYDRLAVMAQAMGRVLSRKPNEVFLIEGHTDAVGQDVDNLTLSDRRAETVAVILSDQFQIPPENLVTQGYGEQYLKVQTQDANRLNRRVAVRRVGPLLAGNARE